MVILTFMFSTWLLWLSSRAFQRQLAHCFGSFSVYITGIIGVSCHEISHGCLALLFGHKITYMELFSPKKNGQLGVVGHSYCPQNAYQQIGNLFIGLAPLAGGLLAISFVTWVYQPEIFKTFGLIPVTSEPMQQAVEMYEAFYRSVAQVDFKQTITWLWLYFVLAIGAHMLPSRADIRNTKSSIALTVIVIVLLVLFLPDVAGRALDSAHPETISH
jgi:hypothetical protein